MRANSESGAMFEFLELTMRITTKAVQHTRMTLKQEYGPHGVAACSVVTQSERRCFLVDKYVLQVMDTNIAEVELTH